MEALAEKGSIPPQATFPDATWTRILSDKQGRRLPQAIAHRGYKAKYPENTMGAFTGAVNVGAHAIETDIHLSKDGVVVLSHDKDLKRCFGRPDKIIERDWKYLSQIQTLREPRQHMPRLLDLLTYLASPGLEEIWLLLDIKLDNDADDVMRLIAKTIQSVRPSKAWNKRVVLGIWAAKYLPLCAEYLPGFPISHIGFSTLYADQFFKVENVSFNMLQAVLMGPCGGRFLRRAEAAQRPVYAWTVNEEKRMRWCIEKKLDGVITDDPKLFLDVCKDHSEFARPESFGLGIWLDVLRINFFAMVYGLLFMWKYRDFRVEGRYIC
ncbi:hypothetical protein W97_03251 [Coniosporium apollinis CBS 100218]|uniref:GP-PDE domain-containing protein n=1 Tax=Coniosporium apollinis (strain CBS 100218) TaxID=1168221 RepID=R7YQT6_CONA1|nr:uncharacterized protein W97_03251 [Coniosporium apollinis CBS 100218]EON64021.1 hypothetical protein W97_03251 [Coniosporium apollinis CBS 100218]